MSSGGKWEDMRDRTALRAVGVMVPSLRDESGEASISEP